MAQKETNLWEGKRKESRLRGSGQAPQHARTAPEMRGLSLCLLGKAPHIKPSALQKDSPPITMIVTQFMCHQKINTFFCCFRIHVNAFFRQCQKREKDMSQSPTSNFVRSCKVTWHANSCSGLQDGNRQNRPLHFALSSKLQGNYS